MRPIIPRLPPRLLAIAVAMSFSSAGSHAVLAAEPYTQLLSVRNVGSQEAAGYYVPKKMGY
jgi:hypothetical protein